MSKVTADFFQAVESSEALDELLCEKGVKVVEVFSEWCGPCASLVGALHGEMVAKDDKVALQFLRCKAEALEEFAEQKNKSEPFFVVYNNGSMVEEITGANAPALKKAIDASFPSPDLSVQDLEDNPRFVARRERFKAQTKES